MRFFVTGASGGEGCEGKWGACLLSSLSGFKDRSELEHSKEPVGGVTQDAKETSDHNLVENVQAKIINYTIKIKQSD